MIIHDIEQGTPEWLALRAGLPTGSEFSNVITGYGKPSDSLNEYAIQLAAEKYAGEPLDTFSGNRHTQRGHELEPEARIDYEFTNNCTVEQVGFITDDMRTYGVSPDGLVNSDGMTEYKCLSAKEHIKVLMYYRQHKKAPPKYKPQTQGQMMVCEREWCDLVFYHPNLPSLTIRQIPDLTFMKTLDDLLLEVISERNMILDVLRSY